MLTAASLRTLRMQGHRRRSSPVFGSAYRGILILFSGKNHGFLPTTGATRPTHYDSFDVKWHYWVGLCGTLAINVLNLVFGISIVVAAQGGGRKETLPADENRARKSAAKTE